jgi:hypothetical protein
VDRDSIASLGEDARHGSAYPAGCARYEHASASVRAHREG